MEFGRLLKLLSTLKYVVIVHFVKFFCCNGALVGAPFFDIGKKTKRYYYVNIFLLPIM